MKKGLLTIAVLLLWANAALALPRAAQTLAVPATAYHFELPADWTLTETGGDPAQALMVARSQAAPMGLYLWLNQRDGWRLSDWKAALLAASGRNGVLTDSFTDETVAERAFASYRYEREGRIEGERSTMHVTELDAGVFLTFEFRTEGAFTAFNEQREAIDAILGSLASGGALE